MNLSNPNTPNPKGLIRRTERATRLATALVGAALAVLVGFAGLTGPGEPLVILSYDIPFIIQRAGGAEDIRMVFLTELDEQSLDRRPQARLLDRLAEEGAKMVVYDLIFDRPSADPAVDLGFAAAMRRFRGVDADGNPIPGAVRRMLFLGCARDTSQKTGYAVETLIVPNDTLLDAADDFGLVVFNEDSFMVRRLTTGTPDEPSLGWKAAQAAGAKLDENARMAPAWFNFAGPPPGTDTRNRTVPIESVDAGTLLTGYPMSGFFRDKIVIIGGQPGIVGQELGQDLFETPFHRLPVTGKVPLMSGVEVQANALANLLNRNWLTRSDERLDHLLVSGCGLLLGVLLSLLKPIRAIIVAVSLFIMAAATGVFTVHFGYLWIPWTIPAFLQIPVALVWGIASNTYVERYFRLKVDAEQKAIRTAFAKYLSPQMLDRLTLEGFNTTLGGNKVSAAVMFTDLEAFTEMCVRIRYPERIVATLNDYFQRTTSSIFDNNGIIVKYIGDAIFAAWGTPIADPHAALNATKAAWKLFQNDKLHVEGHTHRTRIGVHFGEVVAGNIGSDKRIDYTLIGDAVNLAARLEGINKMLETNILLSGEVKEAAVGEFRTRFVGNFIVKGRDEPVEVHELLGPIIQESEPTWISAYNGAMAALRSGTTEEALIHFQRADELRTPDGDGPSRYFIKLIKSSGPPVDGIVKLTEK
jgi:adenylate cyclase